MSVFIERVLTIALGGVFLASAMSKLRHPKSFAVAVTGYGLVPRIAVPLVAASVIAAEVVAGSGLVGAWAEEPCAEVALALTCIFLVVVGVNLRRGRSIPCGCFGTKTPISRGSLFRLFVLATTAVSVLSLARGAGPVTSFSDGLTGPADGFDLVFTSAGVALAGVWVTSARDTWHVISTRQSRNRRSPAEAA